MEVMHRKTIRPEPPSSHRDARLIQEDDDVTRPITQLELIH
jgi:hypothetical protein